MTDGDRGCPCHVWFYSPGSSARLAVLPSGLIVCRWCRRSMHPIMVPTYLEELAPVLVGIAERYRDATAPTSKFTKFRPPKPPAPKRGRKR